MITRYSQDSISWIDVQSPTEEEVASLQTEFGIHPLVGQELLVASRRSRADFYDEQIYLILHLPIIGQKKAKKKKRLSSEIDIVVGKNYLITTHYEPIPVLDKFRKLLEKEDLLKKSRGEPNAGIFLYQLLSNVYHNLYYQLELVSERLKEVETEVFRGNERKMVSVLSEVNKDIIDFNRSTHDHGEIISSLRSPATELFGERYRRYLEMLAGDYEKVKNLLFENKDMLLELRETNDSLLSTKMNETMVRLTMMAFMTFPLVLISSIFSMPTRIKPIIGGDNDFWVILGIMAAVAGITFYFFKQRRWL